jgi:hypothetical protein
VVKLNLEKIGQGEEYAYFDLQELEQRLRRMEAMYAKHGAYAAKFKVRLRLKGMAGNVYLHRVVRNPDYLQGSLDDYDRADVEF